MNKKYTPVSCEIYSRYELAILRGQALRVSWKGARGTDRVETLIPLDLRTKRHAEFMIARDLHGQRRVLRLDRIQRADVLRAQDRTPRH